MACLTAWPPITAPWVWLKPPRTDLARPVRAVETMTACFMDILLKRDPEKCIALEYADATSSERSRESKPKAARGKVNAPAALPPARDSAR